MRTRHKLVRTMVHFIVWSRAGHKAMCECMCIRKWDASPLCDIDTLLRSRISAGSPWLWVLLVAGHSADSVHGSGNESCHTKGSNAPTRSQMCA